MNGDSETVLVFLLACVMVMGAGCIFPIQGSGTSAPEVPMDRGLPAGFAATNPVSVYITYPDFDGGVRAGDVTVTVSINNFSVVDRIGGQNAPGEGHVVYFKDVTPPTLPGLEVVTRPGTYQVSARSWCTWHNVSLDTHTFAVELVNNDNTPLEPPVIDAVDVTAVA